MSNNTSSIVSKVWSFCNPLRDVGMGYSYYICKIASVVDDTSLREITLTHTIDIK